jgi:hypothetical protein
MMRRNDVSCFIMVLIFSLAGFSLVSGALPEGLVFLMTFDEGSGDTVQDLSGFGNDGTVEGKTEWIDGKFKGAFHFDGVTHITVPNADPLNKLTHPMSVGAWVNPDILGGWRNIVEMDAEGMGGWKMGFHDSHCIVWTTYRVQDFISQTPIPTDEWTYVVSTWDGAEAIVYVNGEPDAPMAGGGIIDTKALPSLDIGWRRTTGVSTFQGGMDELFVFNRVLEQDEIKEFMKGFADVLAVKPRGKSAATWGALKR